MLKAEEVYFDYLLEKYLDCFRAVRGLHWFLDGYKVRLRTSELSKGFKFLLDKFPGSDLSDDSLVIAKQISKRIKGF